MTRSRSRPRRYLHPVEATLTTRIDELERALDYKKQRVWACRKCEAAFEASDESKPDDAEAGTACTECGTLGGLDFTVEINGFRYLR